LCPVLSFLHKITTFASWYVILHSAHQPSFLGISSNIAHVNDGRNDLISIRHHYPTQPQHCSIRTAWHCDRSILSCTVQLRKCCPPSPINKISLLAAHEDSILIVYFYAPPRFITLGISPAVIPMTSFQATTDTNRCRNRNRNSSSENPHSNLVFLFLEYLFPCQTFEFNNFF